MQNNEIGPLSYTLHKGQLKMDRRLKHETRNHKHSGGKGKSHHDLLGNDFTNITPKAQAPKPQNKQVEQHPAKKFLHSKGYSKEHEKALCGMED